jgi:ribose 5-phosphate isomerase A
MGGAMLREKIVATASRRYAIVVDESKLVDALGSKGVIPIEIVPEARALVVRELAGMHIECALRMGVRKDGPVVTDSGNLILDASPAGRFDPRELEHALNCIPGVLDNGIFSAPASDVFVGGMSGGVDHRTYERAAGS